MASNDLKNWLHFLLNDLNNQIISGTASQSKNTFCDTWCYHLDGSIWLRDNRYFSPALNGSSQKLYSPANRSLHLAGINFLMGNIDAYLTCLGGLNQGCSASVQHTTYAAGVGTQDPPPPTVQAAPPAEYKPLGIHPCHGSNTSGSPLTTAWVAHNPHSARAAPAVHCPFLKRGS